MIQLISGLGLSFILTLLAACSSSEETPTGNKADTTPPVTIVTPPARTYSKPMRVSIECSDDKSGCDTSKIYYITTPYTENSIFTPYPVDSKIEIKETTSISFYAIDYTGNIETVNTQEYIIDYAPKVKIDALTFTLSDNIMSIKWNDAEDGIDSTSDLKYKLYYAEYNILTSVDATLNIGNTDITKGWHTETVEQFDTRLLPNTKSYFWQVLVKDTFSNLSAYATSQYSASSATIPEVTIEGLLGADLTKVYQLTPGQVTAYFSIDNLERQIMTISSGANSKASFVEPNVTPTIYDLIITYEFTPSNNDSPFILAQTTLTHDFSDGQSRLLFPDTDLVFTFDEDQDLINNITEILAGTNPFSYRWAWMSGSQSTGSAGNYGIKGEPASTNMPGAKGGAVSWIDSNDNVWIFGGVGSGTQDPFNDLWKWDGSNWIWLSGDSTANANGVYGTTQGAVDPNSTPGARRDAVSWTDSSDNLWLFGGIGFGENTNSIGGGLNDLWRWDGSNWIWVSGDKITNANGVYGIKGAESPLNVPSARHGAVSWIDSNDNLWLFGGRNSSPANGGGFTLLNDLWRWNKTTGWVWLSGDSTPYSSGVYGIKGSAGLNNVPGARSDAVSWIDGNDVLWLFGGFGKADDINASAGFLNDLWRWDGQNQNWTWVSGSSVAGEPGIYGTIKVADVNNTPGARMGAISWIDSKNNFWLYGGKVNEIAERSDFWKWDGVSWIWISGSNNTANDVAKYGTVQIENYNNTPGARQNAISWVDKNDKLWLFGGIRTETFLYSFRDVFMNDVWRLNP